MDLLISKEQMLVANEILDLIIRLEFSRVSGYKIAEDLKHAIMSRSYQLIKSNQVEINIDNEIYLIGADCALIVLQLAPLMEKWSQEYDLNFYSLTSSALLTFMDLLENGHILWMYFRPEQSQVEVRTNGGREGEYYLGAVLLAMHALGIDGDSIMEYTQPLTWRLIPG